MLAVDEGWIMERFALRQLLIIQHFDFRQTLGGQWAGAHAAGQATLDTENHEGLQTKTGPIIYYEALSIESK